MTTGTQRRQAIIDQVAACVCKDRQNTYGDAESNFENIAEYWTVWLRSRKLIAADASVQAHDVAVMSGLIKVARLSTSPDHIDNWVDLAGYSVCGGGIRVAMNQPLEYKSRTPWKEEIAVGSRWVSKISGCEVAIRNVDSTLVYYHFVAGPSHGYECPRKDFQTNFQPSSPEKSVPNPDWVSSDKSLPEIKIGSKWVSKSDGWDATIRKVEPDTIYYTLTKIPGYVYYLPVAQFLGLYKPCTA